MHNVLVTNDDGIDAPGLRAVVDALAEHCGDLCKVLVCAPDRERSATSHAIKIARAMTVVPDATFPSCLAAYAVGGNPADCTMIALAGPIFEGIEFSLVLSGINRGENCGLHVCYSGTVAGAREGVKCGVPGIASSLNDFSRGADYKESARLLMPLVRHMLQRPAPRSLLLNVNVPKGPAGGMRGYHLTRQDLSCVQPKFTEVKEMGRSPSENIHPVNEPVSVAEAGGTELPERTGHGSMPALRTWILKNIAGKHKMDSRDGFESKMLREGWVTVTPLGLRQDLPFGEHQEGGEELVKAAVEAVQAAARDTGMTAKL